jgi:hypothetical protein
MPVVVVVPAQLVLPEGPGAPASVVQVVPMEHPRARRVQMELTAPEAAAVVVVLRMQSGPIAVVRVDLVL